MKGEFPLVQWIRLCLTPRIARTIPRQYEGDTPPLASKPCPGCGSPIAIMADLCGECGCEIEGP